MWYICGMEDNNRTDRIKKKAAGLLTLLESGVDMVKNNKNSPPPYEIVGYRGYGTSDYLYCRGRVLQNKGIVASGRDGAWRNLLNSYHRFESDEVPGQTLQASYGGQKFEMTSNEEGYFMLDTPLSNSLKPNISIWQSIEFELQSPDTNRNKKLVNSDCQILVPNQKAEYGVISDLDDTVLKSNVISKVKMIYLALFKNAYTRLAFRGVPALYWALRKGSSGDQKNPIFYVSNSPWNLYDVIDEFMDVNHIPKGPVLLRDFGHANNPALSDAYKKHKYNETVKILETYPHLPFILIGDSGEKDADMYLEVAKNYPGRILCIYIRTVKDKKRTERVKKLAKGEINVPLLLIEDSLDIAKHAVSNGFITRQAMYRVNQSLYNDRSSVVDFWLEEE